MAAAPGPHSTGTQAATIQGQLNFSRDVEREADRVGFQVMTAAGFAPGGMAAMFEKMDRSARLNDFGGFVDAFRDLLAHAIETIDLHLKRLTRVGDDRFDTAELLFGRQSDFDEVFRPLDRSAVHRLAKPGADQKGVWEQ